MTGMFFFREKRKLLEFTWELFSFFRKGPSTGRGVFCHVRSLGVQTPKPLIHNNRLPEAETGLAGLSADRRDGAWEGFPRSDLQPIGETGPGRAFSRSERRGLGGLS